MKKSLLLLAMLLIPAISASAGEPLILAPLDTVLSTSPVSTPGVYVDGLPEVDVEAGGSKVYEAIYTPNAATAVIDDNMVPQNAAAKGEPIPVKRQKLINIRTKQRSQGNDYWNPGGKGNKTFFD